jgi:hypothetical protein
VLRIQIQSGGKNENGIEKVKKNEGLELLDILFRGLKANLYIGRPLRRPRDKQIANFDHKIFLVSAVHFWS